MSATRTYTFESNPDRRPGDPHPDSPRDPEPYLANPELVKAVNLAIYLTRPLLLEGDAGCGKTRLASAVAYELGLPLYRWDIRSTTKAQEGLYTYDAILRLHDVEVQKGGLTPSRDPSVPSQYVEFGELGKAFQLIDRPAVVLIDEIDKADLDFPNDLLAVLDDPWSFTVKETGDDIQATHRPIVIITSNKEKGNLPAPFLRRCLYHYVEFPNDSKRLKAIVARHYRIKQESAPPSELVDVAVDRFLAIWTRGGLFKKPGTSEFLDWLKALHTFESPSYPAEQLASDTLLPYRELLFKRQDDWRNYARAS